MGDPTAHLGEGEESDDEDLIGYDSIEPGLPPASSDRQKWWLDNRQPARAQVTVPNGRDGMPMALNPNRPSNPFGQTDEPDWVSVPRSSPGYSSLSSSPYEKVSLPKAMTSQGSVARKQLPQAFDSSKLPAQVGRLRLDDEQNINSQSDGDKSATPPPPPPPRRQTANSRPSTSTSTPSGLGLDRTQTLPPLPTTPRSASVASQASQVSQLSQQLANKSSKSPPPVGKKPAHLAIGSPLSKTTTGSTTISPSTRSDDATPSLPARSASSASQASLQASLARKAVTVAQQQNSSQPPQPLTRRSGTLPTAIASGGQGQGQGGAHKGAPGVPGHANGFKPPLPSRHGQPAAASFASADLLDSMNDGGEGMGGWEALQPSSKQ